MASLKISIIIPAFNEEVHLRSCLSSLRDTDYPKEDIEIIVVDNGSSDRTRAVARDYGVKVLRNDTMNVSGLRNLGVSESSGEIIGFIDADCIVSKNWLENTSKYFDDCSIVAWGSPPVIPEDPTWVQETWFIIRGKENKVQEVQWLESMNLFVRKVQFNNIGGFNESLVTCEDVDLCYRMKKSGKIISDRRIKVIHKGEARSIREFIRKEIWRGSSNLKGILSHGIRLEEAPSLLVPIYFGLLFFLIFICFFFFKNPFWFVIGGVIYILPSIFVLFKFRKRLKAPVQVIRLILLMQIYFFCRTVAVFRIA